MKTNNFLLEVTTTDQVLLLSLQLKQKVLVLRNNAEVMVRTESDEELGSLPKDCLDEYHENVQFDGFIRSISRQTDQTPTSIHVAIFPKKRGVDPQRVPRWEAETVEEEWLLKEQDYELLVSNEDLRRQLKDPELQRILKSVDGAQNRETALHEAHQGTDKMKTFLEKLLNILESKHYS